MNPRLRTARDLPRAAMIGALLLAGTVADLLADAPPAQSAPFEAHYLDREQATPLAPRPEVLAMRHIVLHYDKGTYCGHPRMVLFQHFRDDEIIVGHFHAPCRYQEYADVRHVNYQNRGVLLLQRSTNGGETWPKEAEQVLFDNTWSAERKRAFLSQGLAGRGSYDMFQSDSVFLFGQTYLTSEYEKEVPPCFMLRSADRGRTFEKVPTVIRHPQGPTYRLTRHNTPVIRMPDGKTLLAAFQMADEPGPLREAEPAVFVSTDNGATWRLFSRPVVDRSGQGSFHYPTLFVRPDGELQCYALHIAKKDEVVAGMRNAIVLVKSRDGGRTWSEPVPIVGKGGDCWKNPHGEGVIYRSPYPIALRDGRILLVFARRRMPGGIGGIVSRDNGQTWSEEFVLRDDGEWWDLGYPVGCQLRDGRILVIYYFPVQDGNGQGGTRSIAGTFFRLGE
ncbi:MAG: exo-alpha-sialidase [Planctomycetes bacterium]|nr:exo-alpha-sialidase [Planctomycetota bacterium]